MTNDQAIGVGTHRRRHKTVSTYSLEDLRVRAVARRRIEQRKTAKWVGNRSRREKIRVLGVCVGTFLLMAAGLYFGLAHDEATSPAGSAESIGALVIV